MILTLFYIGFCAISGLCDSSLAQIKAKQMLSVQRERHPSVQGERREDDRPFWKSKAEIRRRLLEERLVVVSASAESAVSSPSQIKFTINGAGIVSVPKAFAFRAAQDYKRLKEVSSHFRTVEYNSASRDLHLVIEALGYQARMVLNMRPTSEDWRDELRWKVISGDFRGMKGVIAFEAVDWRRTEVSIESAYQAATLPLPKVLMGLALEAIVQKVAEQMRSVMENRYSETPQIPVPTVTSAPASRQPAASP